MARAVTGPFADRHASRHRLGRRRYPFARPRSPPIPNPRSAPETAVQFPQQGAAGAPSPPARRRMIPCPREAPQPRFAGRDAPAHVADEVVHRESIQDLWGRRVAPGVGAEAGLYYDWRSRCRGDPARRPGLKLEWPGKHVCGVAASVATTPCGRRPHRGRRPIVVRRCRDGTRRGLQELNTSHGCGRPRREGRAYPRLRCQPARPTRAMPARRKTVASRSTNTSKGSLAEAVADHGSPGVAGMPPPNRPSTVAVNRR